MRPTEVETLYIWRSDRLMGRLLRTAKGCQFEYDMQLLQLPDRPKLGVASTLPYQLEPYKTEGVNLPPFFANLLPEGLRFQALTGKLKTSKDDLFSLLVATGEDCIGDVFATSSMTAEQIEKPSVNIADFASVDFAEIEKRSVESATDATIPGEQPKLSAAKFTATVRTNASKLSILKLSPSAYPLLVENEQFFMNCARRCNIRVAKANIVSDKAGRVGLLVERFDRRTGDQGLKRIHTEDACQFSDYYPADKYRMPMSTIAKNISSLCDAAPVQMLRLFELCLFSYMIGNCDLHAKNISIIEDPRTGLIELSPAYDLVSTLPYSKLDRHMALKMDGKDDGFKASDFVRFFGRFGLAEAAILQSISKISNRLKPQLERIGEIGFDAKITLFLRDEISRRIERVIS